MKQNEVVKSDEVKELRLKIQNFQKILHRNPDPKEVQELNGNKYLPISFLEMTMDEMFFTLWQTKNFKTQVIANEMIGSIELEYFHPTALVWLTRTGAAGKMIMFKSKKNGGSGDITNIKDKIPNTLGKDYPALKAECFRNACLGLGKAFGRDLNREYRDLYDPVIKENQNDFEHKIIDGLDVYQGEDLEEIQIMCAEKSKAGEFTKEFAESVAKTIGITL